ncbi:MAG: glycoside hydrolase family 108 protein [Actinomycetota bacterium]
MPPSLDPFKTALQFTLKWEGGVGDPNDLAGVVNRGISQDTYDTYCQQKALPKQSVHKITDSEVEDLYRELFWKRSKAELMCLPLAVVHFDTAVNFSVSGSVEFLQEALGLKDVDGRFGPKTAAALEKQNNLDTAKRYCQGRMDYRRQRVQKNPSQQVFLEGWLLRDQDLLKYINQLSGEVVTTKQPTNPEPTAVTPTPSDRSSSISPENQQQVVEKLEQAISLLEEIVSILRQK